MNGTSKLIMALEELQQAELSELRCNIPEHKFSRTFERKMKKLFNTETSFEEPVKAKPRYMLKYALIAIIILVLLTACGAVVVHLVMGGVHYDDYGTHTLLHGENDENAPKSIEQKYDITYNLEGYTRTVNNDDVICRYISYTFEDRYVEIIQSTISDFTGWLNTEDANVSEIEINGHKAIICNFSKGGYYVLWNNDDYIIEINSNLDKSTIINIAESVDIQ